VAGDDACLRIHQNRVVKTELGNAGRDLRNLSVRVSTRVSRPRDQLIDKPHLDVLGHAVRGCDRFSRHQIGISFSA